MAQLTHHLHVSSQVLAPRVRPLLPTPPRRADVVVVIDDLEQLETGTLAGLLQIYSHLLARGASSVRFQVVDVVAAELTRLGLTHLLHPPKRSASITAKAA